MFLLQKLLMVLLFSLFLGCTPNSYEDYRAQASGVMHRLVKELEKVNSIEQLETRRPKLKNLNMKLVNIMIEVRQCHRKECSSHHIVWSHGKESEVAWHLKEELERIYQIAGARELMEEIQKDALEHLDAFETMYARKLEKSRV